MHHSLRNLLNGTSWTRHCHHLFIVPCPLFFFFCVFWMLIKSEDQCIKSQSWISHKQNKAMLNDPSVQRCCQVNRPQFRTNKVQMEALTSQHCLLLALSLPKQWKCEGGCVQMQWLAMQVEAKPPPHLPPPPNLLPWNIFSACWFTTAPLSKKLNQTVQKHPSGFTFQVTGMTIDFWSVYWWCDGQLNVLTQAHPCLKMDEQLGRTGCPELVLIICLIANLLKQSCSVTKSSWELTYPQEERIILMYCMCQRAWPSGSRSHDA